MGKEWKDTSLLAVQAQTGDQQDMLNLWKEVKSLCFRIGKKYLPLFRRTGMDTNDFIQELFCAVWQATRAYNPNICSFNTFVTFYVQNQCRAVLGIRSGQNITDQLNERSLQEHVSNDTDGLTLLDMLSDPEAEEAFSAAIDRQDGGRLHDDLEEALSKLPPMQEQIVRARYYQGKTYRQLAEVHGKAPSTIQEQERKAFRRLRNMAALSKYREEFIDTQAYHGTSYSAWKHGSSVQERVVERMEELGYYA